MRFIGLLCAALLLTSTVTVSAEERAAVAPFSGTDLNGKPLDLKTYLGKVVIVTFWATWCKPCKKAIPHFDKIAQADDNVALIAISIDDAQTRSRVRGLVKRYKWKSPVIVDEDGSIAANLNSRGLAPLTLIIDKKGRLAWSQEGYNKGDEAKVAQQVKTLLAEP